jgi:hypothetical protein
MKFIKLNKREMGSVKVIHKYGNPRMATGVYCHQRSHPKEGKGWGGGCMFFITENDAANLVNGKPVNSQNYTLVPPKVKKK